MPTTREEFGQLWNGINRGIHGCMREAFRDADLNLMSLFLLRKVGDDPGVTIADIARSTGFVKSHISKTVDQLVQKGLLEKRFDPDDQRLVRIYPTRTSDETRTEMEERAFTALAAILDEVPAEEIEPLLHGLRILLAAVEKANKKVKS